MMTKTYRVTMCQTIRLINDVYVEAESQEEATALMVERLTEDDWGWYDRSSWGEAYYYGVEKQCPDGEDFEVLEVDLCDEEEAA